MALSFLIALSVLGLGVLTRATWWCTSGYDPPERLQRDPIMITATVVAAIAVFVGGPCGWFCMKDLVGSPEPFVPAWVGSE